LESYLLRLRTIEGQGRGLQRLVEDDTYCVDILTQIASVNATLQKVALGLVDQHLRHASWTIWTPNQRSASSASPDATLAVQGLRLL
jgi:DNA-binding FrmR family transcriptional regulator